MKLDFSKIKKVIVFIKNNIYKIMLLLFVIWILLIDESSFVNQRKLTKEIESLEATRRSYEKQINQNNKLINVLSNKKGIESFAREQYLMKKRNEDIFIITYDTLK